MESLGTRYHYPKQVRDALTKAYNETPAPTGVRLNEIALKTKLPIKDVRRWFYQKKYRLKLHSKKLQKEENKYRINPSSKRKKVEKETQTDISEKMDDGKQNDDLKAKTPNTQELRKIDIPPGYKWYLILQKSVDI